MNAIFSDTKVQEAIVTALVALLLFIAGLLSYGVKKLSSVDRVTKSTRQQVTNDHPTNLRDDVSKVIAEVGKIADISAQNSKDISSVKDALDKHIENQSSEFRHVRYVMGELHGQIDRESKDRQITSARVDGEHARLWKALENMGF